MALARSLAFKTVPPTFHMTFGLSTVQASAQKLVCTCLKALGVLYPKKLNKSACLRDISNGWPVQFCRRTSFHKGHSKLEDYRNFFHFLAGAKRNEIACFQLSKTCSYKHRTCRNGNPAQIDYGISSDAQEVPQWKNSCQYRTLISHRHEQLISADPQLATPSHY